MVCEFLFYALVGCEWSAAFPLCFTAGDKPKITLKYKAGWAPQLVWTSFWKRKIPCPRWYLNPPPWSCSLYPNHCTNYTAIALP